MDQQQRQQTQKIAPLWRPEFEHDNCGTGFVAHARGEKSHSIVKDGLEVLNRLNHRGAAGADPDTGDGAGILTQIPDAFFRKTVGFALPEEGKYAVAQIFLSRDPEKRAGSENLIAETIASAGHKLLGIRTVPVNLHACGNGARISAPWVTQFFIEYISGKQDDASVNVTLYVLRRKIEKTTEEAGHEVYVVSLSHKTIIYKGMMHAWQLSDFYPDLEDPSYASALAMVHSRYSTNTFPSWSRAQPCRYMAHNGEINTLRGVESSTSAAENFLHGGLLKEKIKETLPIIQPDGSDSMKFDNLFEFLWLSGRPMPQVLMMMMPGPWSKDVTMPEEQRQFYQYAACMLPPWDGPAAITFTDGTLIGGVLDRNGLRPARWTLTRDHRMILASEAGVLDIPPQDIIRKGKLGPNQMILLDTSTGVLKEDAELKATYCKGPWNEWLKTKCVETASIAKVPFRGSEKETVDRMQRIFGWTYEDRMNTILPMTQTGIDPVGAMGFDAPLAVLSKQHQPLFNYFQQLFAQVTNPPIDSIQEEMVTGMDVFIGKSSDFTQDLAENCVKIHLATPILSPSVFSKLKQGIPGFKPVEVPMLFTKEHGLKKGLEAFFENAEKAIRDGGVLLILTDKDASEDLIPIPSLLAAAGLHHHLIRKGIRGECSLIVDSFEPREVHHAACLIGYGVKAVYPRGAYEVISDMVKSGHISNTEEKAIDNYIHAVDHGILKIMSKMGISCVDGYIRAQIFEAVGLSQELVDEYFTGTVTRVGGLTLDEIEEDCLRHHKKFVAEMDQALPSGGRFQWKRDGEEHLYNPETIHLIQTAVRNNDYELYKEYKRRISDESRVTLRSLLGFKNGKRVPLDEVEPVERIMRRFKTGAMSYGSLSQEAHECLAEAMNIIGGKSNSGEGGEDSVRFGTVRNSKIKQVASGRFGVTSEYLASAEEIQIKMAQGAKPGEGGQLPGSKVYPWVARVRNSTPGVGLISPPPHHDIYSIEDLAQLIYDLKNSNPMARINVKLVSETGVGTVAAGVAKGGADVILISGYDGGTGASPRTSIQHAGLPWEIGLSESHQTLMANGLRGRVRLEVDGKLMTGRDVAIAALMGAEEFGFATLPLVAVGCVMMRVCNLDTCPVGVATQNPALRARFSGKPEYVVNLMRFIAQDLREIMAELGFRSVDEMVGRAASALVQESQSVKTKHLDLSPLISCDLPLPWHVVPETENHNRLFHDMVRSLIASGGGTVKRKVSNTERTIATRVGYFISKEYGKLPDGHLKFFFEGIAGQSFGAFIPKGIELKLEGEANDYVGKGLSGGRIIIKAPENAGWSQADNLLCGNVALFGATSGELYLAGRAGERFCVRNSGAKAVCEGVGEHGCEYMTGGVAAILGPVGRNFASGMSGGIAYVLEDESFRKKCNTKMVGLYELDAMDVVTLYTMIRKHVEYTGSVIGREILDNWPKMVHRFVKVLPNDYKEMLDAMAKATLEGLTGDAMLSRAFSIKTGAGR